jgi:hypothetical protein
MLTYYRKNYETQGNWARTGDQAGPMRKLGCKRPFQGPNIIFKRKYGSVKKF